MTPSWNLARLMSAGGSIQAPLLLHGVPASALEAADKSYVDQTVAAIGGIPEAPLNVNAYGRSNAAWVQVLPLAGGTLTGPLMLAADPTTGLGAATRQYVDNKALAYLPLAGGVLSGVLTLSGNPPTALAAAPKQYVDAGDATRLPLAGGTMTGPIVLAADPVTSTQAATKNYVDTHAASGGLGDAPSDGNTYGRLNAAWVSVVPMSGATLNNMVIDAGTF